MASLLPALSKPSEIPERDLCAAAFLSQFITPMLVFGRALSTQAKGKQASKQGLGTGRGRNHGSLYRPDEDPSEHVASLPTNQDAFCSPFGVSVGGEGGYCYRGCCKAELREPPAHHVLPNPFCFSRMTDISQPPAAHLAKILTHPKVQMAAASRNREAQIKSKQAEQTPGTNTWS